jgi:hypothetical protein
MKAQPLFLVIRLLKALHLTHAMLGMRRTQMDIRQAQPSTNVHGQAYPQMFRFMGLGFQT